MIKKSKNTNHWHEVGISLLWKKILLIAALLFVGLFFAHKILFVNADLGRHIKNGEMVLSSEFAVLTSNFYSYTEQNFPLINHHWGSGLIFYLVWKFFGFEGLSLLNILLIVATAFLFFRIAEKKSNFVFAFFTLILSVPLISGRTEIRPEAFSYLLAGLFYYLPLLFSEKKISFRKIIFIIPPLQLLWVNLHIFFILGIFLIGIFWMNAILKKKQVKELSIMLSAVVFLSFINPNGLKGFLEPFMILREYGYMIAENQSLFFMQGRFPDNMMYLHFEILFVLIIVGFIIPLSKLVLSGAEGWRGVRGEGIHFNPHFIIFLFFSALAIKMVRGIPLWGLFFIPFASGVFYNIHKNYLHFKRAKNLQRFYLAVVLVIMGCGFLSKNNYYSPFKGYSGLGLFENVNRSAEFIKKNNIDGPVFNNYDIGGYFIFNLFPQYRVFVDNRPEAYSVDFFKKIYEPMQESEEKWKEYSQKYNFNCIYFFRHDNTPNAQPFLIHRINDEEWAPVFVDDFTIIFLKRNMKNSELIKKYELPKSMFSAIPQ